MTHTVLDIAPVSDDYEMFPEPRLLIDGVYVHCTGENQTWAKWSGYDNLYQCNGTMELVSVAPIESSIAGSNYGFVTFDGYAIILPALVSLVVVVASVLKLKNSG